MLHEMLQSEARVGGPYPPEKWTETLEKLQEVHCSLVGLAVILGLQATQSIFNK